MGCVAVFPQVKPLPGAQGQAAASDGDREVDGGQRGAHVRGHVVVALGGVDEKPVAIRHQTGEECLEIAPDVGVGVFLDEERGRRVPKEQRQQAVAEAVLRNPALDLPGHRVKAAAAGADTQFVSNLAHVHWR